MAYKPKPWVDKAWLAWFILQLLVIVFVDALQFYPKSLYATEGSPLHALKRLHDYYVATYNDPIVQWELPGRPWTRLFGLIEVGFQLPTAAYGVYLLSSSSSSRRSVGYADEMLFFLYALETAFTTLVCVHDVAYWDDAVYSPQQKRVFWLQLYGPWLLIPSIMAVDMFFRLQARLAAGAERKTK
ncbi:hypothetical protein MAPG_09582 [Magnaporthiopsis poae ATCC 64411]|uniref:Efficient mitochondria targeting-associated protein 19 n=1 Tax=Magnaporthiopsis poae (strain ATCC 64411 / 73-15) TaxID=644358 RepID=A0A0C4EAB7_MAGP6|nr:hypothetical protein MAPG_09582 [Magnaporthiopsis poae ATCC 64411]